MLAVSQLAMFPCRTYLVEIQGKCGRGNAMVMILTVILHVRPMTNWSQNDDLWWKRSIMPANQRPLDLTCPKCCSRYALQWLTILSVRPYSWRSALQYNGGTQPCDGGRQRHVGLHRNVQRNSVAAPAHGLVQRLAAAWFATTAASLIPTSQYRPTFRWSPSCRWSRATHSKRSSAHWFTPTTSRSTCQSASLTTNTRGIHQS